MSDLATKWRAGSGGLRRTGAEHTSTRSGVIAETAWLLAGAFGTGAEFWVELQSNYDLARSRPTRVGPRTKKAS